jgi:hypothetical protein
MPSIAPLTVKEINALLQALRIAQLDGELLEYIKISELNSLRRKLSNIKD